MSTPTPPEGYKVVKGEDIKDCVPEGALIWEADKWMDSVRVGKSLKFALNSDYAIPIKPSKATKIDAPSGLICPIFKCWGRPCKTILGIRTEPAKQDIVQLTQEQQASITDEAKSIVDGDRAVDYGDVNESFDRIAKLWSAYKGVAFTPWDVAQMMILLKVSRAKTSRKRDTLIDIIGYAECASNLKS